MRLIPALSLCCAAGIGLTAWTMLRGGAAAGVTVPARLVERPAAGESAAELRAARRSCSREALDRAVAALRQRSERLPGDRDGWRLLAEGLLERVLQSTHRRGMAVGTPVRSELPPEVEADVADGLAALAQARRLGDDSADGYRLEAALLSQRITGLTAALQWNGRIEEALAAATARDRDDPQVHVALGLRCLLAPELLGHDPQQALAHFEFAARSLADDERPAVFAAMASFLQKKRLDAIRWLETAVERNPANGFARAVLARVRRGEDDPFGRDVGDAEAAGR